MSSLRFVLCDEAIHVLLLFYFKNTKRKTRDDRGFSLETLVSFIKTKTSNKTTDPGRNTEIKLEEKTRGILWRYSHGKQKQRGEEEESTEISLFFYIYLSIHFLTVFEKRNAFFSFSSSFPSSNRDDFLSDDFTFLLTFLSVYYSCTDRRWNVKALKRLLM